MDTQNRVCLSVCTRCRPPEFKGSDQERPGYRLAAEILRLASDDPLAQSRLTVRGIQCMSQCKRPCVVALSAPDKFTLVFGDLDVWADAEAVMTLVHQYAQSADGLVPRSDRPASLQAGILGRIPPLGYAGEIIDPDFSYPPNQP
ncbi:MAG: DUF1636 domain-containing protein [Pseudomonadota bacterium]